jgi:hypothetical protein
VAVVVTMVGATVAAQAPQPKTYANTAQIMRTMTVPLSDAVFAAAGEAPKDDAGWQRVEEQALALAEVGNLLMSGSRVVDRADWIKMAQAQIDAAEAIVKAAAARNAEELSTKGDALSETCAACHNKYMKK